MRTRFKRCLSLLMSLVMCFSLAAPNIAYAAKGDTTYFYSTHRSGASLITDTSTGMVNCATTHKDKAGNVAYCFAQGRANPNGEYKYEFIGYASSKVAAILDAGYPNTTTIGGQKLSADAARQATQAALWCFSNDYNKNSISISKLRITNRDDGEALAAAKYLVETASKKGSDSLYGIYQTVTSGSGYQTMISTVNEKPATGKLTLTKTSSSTGITSGNNNYSLKGAVYGVYSNKGCTSQVTTLTTNASGKVTSGELAAGTYYVKEKTASAGYTLDSTVYTVKITSGDTTSLTVKEKPVTGSISLIKSSSNTAISSGNSNYSLKGAVYGVYSDKGCTKQVTTMTTDANGKASASGLALGTYYVKEKTAPAGYQVDSKVYSATITSSNSKATLNLKDVPVSGKIALNKASSNTNITHGNSCYALQGAVYGVYGDKSCTKQIATMTTDENGTATTSALALGTYYIKEKTASSGYLLDTTVYTVNLNSASGASLNVEEEPANDPVGITLTKISDQAVDNPASLAGAQFTVRYYDGQYSSISELPSTATRTWVIETKKVTGSGKTVYMTALDGAYKVSGDKFYYNADGSSVVLPLGTITIEETKAANGYTLDGSYLNTASGTITADSNGVILLNVTLEGGLTAVKGGNAYTKEEVSIRGGIEIRKLDADLNEALAQGNASLSGAVYDIVSLNDYDVEVNGKAYAKDQTVYTLTTDSTGKATTSTSLLPAGNYRIVERSAPTGYLCSGVTEYEFTISEDGKIVDLTSVLEDEVIRGGVRIYKMDAELRTAAGTQGDASLENAVFEIVNRSANPVYVNGVSYASGEVVYSGKTDKNGLFTTTADLLPYGTYEIRESADGQPEGYLHEGTLSRTFDITTEGEIVDLTDSANSILNDIIRGGVKVQKRDLESGATSALGSATLEGATFEIINRSANAVISNGISYEPGQVVYTGTTDKNGLFTTATDLLPYGTYEVIETKAPDGYLPSGFTSRTFSITKDGTLVDLTAESNSIQDQVIRGDFRMRKIDGDTQKNMANVLFKITSNTTGEYHYFTTDTNGYYSTASNWLPHSQDTNGGTASSGLWFGKTEVNDALGALPFDTYTIEEMPCDANQSYVLCSFTLTIYQDGYEVDMGNIENFQIRIATTALDAESNSHYAGSVGQVTITDTVSYENLVSGTTYTLVGTLMNRETNEPITDASGAPITATKEITPKLRYGTTDMEFTFDASLLAGVDVVVFEALYLNGTLVAEHKDINDEGQTIHLAEIGTNAADSETKFNLSKADDSVTVIDTVSYKNLNPGKKYTLTGILMDQATGKPMLDTHGKEITAKTTFKPEASAGTVTVSFTFDASSLAGKSAVVFETLTRRDNEIAVHADIHDEAQTIHFPEISTSAIDTDNKTHNAMPDDSVCIVDTVSYKNLVPGREYVVNGTLVDQSTGAYLQSNGENITAEATFTPSEANGSVNVTFIFDGTGLEGESVVVFETLYYEGIEVAVHADINDEAQTIHFPEISTTAQDKENGTHTAMPDEEATIVDTVTYENLILGQEYSISGILMDKATGDPLLDAEGNEITAKAAFIAESAIGAIDLEFILDASLLAGETVVVFETLYTNEKMIGIHADINDEAQAIHFPEIGTTAIDEESVTHNAHADESVTIVDTVAYENLVPGQEYTIFGILMNKSTGESLKYNDTDIIADITFIAESAAGSIDLAFTLDASALAGETVVAFETLYTNEKMVGIHADINDEAQTIHFPKIGTTALDQHSATHNAHAATSVTIIDTVTYENLIPGQEYSVFGILMDKATGKPLMINNMAVTAEATFIAEAANGSLDLELTFDASDMAGESVVVFETLYTNDAVIAVHTDIDDEEQTIHFPKLGTTAIDKETGTHTAMPDEDVTIVDTVAYENLIPGQEYTIYGALIDKATTEVLRDAEGMPITSEVTFTAESVNGSIDVEFYLDASTLAGQTTVVFECIYTNEKLVGLHADINDEAQTIHFPVIGTTAIDKETGTHSAYADKSVTIIDTVTYENLVPGQEYTLSGILMDKETGEPLLVDGETVISTVTFVPSESNGSIAVAFIFNGSGLTGKTVVVFESLCINDVLVSVHADIEDVAQSVFLEEPPSNPKTDDFSQLRLFTIACVISGGVMLSLILIEKLRRRMYS